jgi:hypothetical protein
MKDIHIREVLLRDLRSKHVADPNTVVIQEMGLCKGDARVDLAVVNGHLHGYEIKSDEDNLDRLPSQRDLYGKVFDRMTVVSGARHLSKVRRIVPEWWGIQRAELGKSGVEIHKVRGNKPNPKVDPQALAQLLWRDEALAKLRKLNLHSGLVNRPRKVLWARLVRELSVVELACEVRERLRTRPFWRPQIPTPSLQICAPTTVMW